VGWVVNDEVGNICEVAVPGLAVAVLVGVGVLDGVEDEEMKKGKLKAKNGCVVALGVGVNVKGMGIMVPGAGVGDGDPCSDGVEERYSKVGTSGSSVFEADALIL